MTDQKPRPENTKSDKNADASAKTKKSDQNVEKEIGGYEDQNLPEPTRFGDWEVKGRCSDF